ncbi:PDZ domain-containing protein [Siphonobacter aquaeclarae]|uniref:Uncharacterized protein n=1 Tax=Siphonobacter aquaeclarae TaxID=563176 RepID=A0A1G9Q0D4_9BACT|nr:PDZ domain-containing protein [Siphonobacter aquaeclarae]SDM04528.1 Protein of unknown function [Siphonobacter aquaeclarae]
MYKLICCLLLAGLTAGAQSVVRTVSPSGNDANPGTPGRPMKTLAAALQKKGGDVVIQLREGTYYLPETVEIRAGQFSSLTIRPYEKENVTLSAGRLLTLRWKPFRDGIFQAELPDDVPFERLYVDERSEPLARYPNEDPQARVFGGTAADALAPERVARWQHPAGGYVHGLHAGEWGGFHYRITGKDEKGGLQLDGGWQNNRPAPLHKQHRMVENIFEELDAPGEWFADRQKRILYYFPRKGTPPATVVVSRLKNTLELKGTPARPLRNVAVEGIRFAHNERTFMETKEPLLRSDWTIYRGGVVTLEGTENCRISRCEFAAVGGNAVFLSKYNRNDTIRSCHIHHTGASAIAFVGDSAAVRSPLFRYEHSQPYAALDRTPGPKSNAYPKGCVAFDNLIHHVGQMEKQATGVQIEMAEGIVVSHNTIYHTPRAGINIGDGAWGGHILEHNDVFETVLETGDHGAFNSWGRDRYWSPNRRYMDSLAAAHPELILLDAQHQTVIRYNRFRCDHGWDVDLDDGSSNYYIHHNVCLNGGLKLREGFYRKVENNVLVNNSFHPHVWFRNSGDRFERNIVMKPYFPIQVDDWGPHIDFNLFPDTSALAAARQSGTDAHSAAGDPQFVAAATGDYRVKDTSPALALGFRNFPMDDFGVVSADLKKMAAKPAIPQPISMQSLASRSARAAFLGGKVKNVEGLGERSAYGLPDETGVIVVETGGLLATSGILAKDVIRSADGQPVKTCADLLNVYQASNWKGHIGVDIIRNQQPLKLTLQLK